MIGVYVRVSTVGQNVAGQKREIQRWLDGNGIENPVWYIDRVTGDNLDRPEFQRLQTDIFHGKIKTVVIWKLDRLSRSLRDGINVLADWCDKGLRVVSNTQQIDFNGTVGKMLAAVLLGLAELEQETRRERQAAGISAAKERSVYAGRQPGTTKAKPQRAAELREQGLSDGEIAAALHVSRRTVQRYLHSIAVGRNGSVN
jgi:DNA invertase Pin-like site-specific DNA recombinase